MPGFPVCGRWLKRCQIATPHTSRLGPCSVDTQGVQRRGQSRSPSRPGPAGRVAAGARGGGEASRLTVSTRRGGLEDRHLPGSCKRITYQVRVGDAASQWVHLDPDEIRGSLQEGLRQRPTCASPRSLPEALLPFIEQPFQELREAAFHAASALCLRCVPYSSCP